MTDEKRRTHFDRLYAVHEALIPFFLECKNEDGDAHASMLESSLTQMQPGSQLLATARKSEIAASKFILFRELFSAENRRYSDFDDTLRMARTVFEREYPDFFAKQRVKRDKAIDRGKLRTDSEYELVREYIYELERESSPPDMLDKLYRLVDDYAAG